MTTFVLVHGAWGGSYAWRSVRAALHAAGHEAVSPSLTGIGERSHLTGPTVDLDLHVTDVVNAIRYEDLTDIVLVGWSYGGMVITGALDRLDGRVRSLVYLDALLPSDRQCAFDLVPFPRPADEPGAPWSVPPLPRELDTPEATAWSEARRVNQPVGTLAGCVSLREPLEDRGLRLAYIKATDDPNEAPDSAFWKAAEHAQASSAWEYHGIDTNHMVPLMRPAELTELLIRLA
ncbi:MAG: alpha/beta hydrolase [Actinomycetota bacterium]